MTRFVEHYTTARLQSGIGYVTPWDMFQGRQQEIHAERDRNLTVARDRRALACAAQRKNARHTEPVVAEDTALLGSNLSAATMPMTGASGVLATFPTNGTKNSQIIIVAQFGIE